MPPELKLYSPKEANEFIPRLTQVLGRLRSLRDQIAREKDKYDIEEITSHGTSGKVAEMAKESMDAIEEAIRAYEMEFEKELEWIEEVGCLVKSLDPGLVDFYTKIHGQLVFLCWKEGEPEIQYWHDLESGFTGRQLLE